MEYRFIEVLIFLFGFSFSINSYFSKKDRKSLAQAMFFLILMLYCGSRTGLLAIVVALSFNIFKEKQMNLTLFITVFFASILLIDSITSQVIVNRLERLSEISLFTQLNLDLAIEEDRDVRRILYIKGGIEMFLNDFWFGTGLGSFQEAFPTYLMAQVGVEEVARPHNMYVSIAATSGVFGVFFLFGWILVLIKGSFNKNSLIDKSLVTFGISILVLSSGYDLETSPIFWIFMAILVGLSRNRSLINNFVYLKKN
ncbi:O-antigen ligase [uncultured Thiothrix sp.]|uniref:O-antigen ligase family protein n=1 Tax=uncultured Thiothrix sp. TaxID=223185 RepID=UPI002616D36E|nr:O-antigen ligase family protein [uncultured Thiothrix sp.]